MQVDEKFIRSVVEQVITRLGATARGAHLGGGTRNRFGLVYRRKPGRRRRSRGLRATLPPIPSKNAGRIIGHIRRIAIDQCVELGTNGDGRDQDRTA